MKDLFSAQSATYARHRPLYPQRLYQFIYSHVNTFHQAWDCGTGNGQVARELAKKFEKVLATDISAAQLEHAAKAPNILYRQNNENLPGVPSDSFDLITVAAALHWFDFDRFYAEVNRVGKPNAVFATWCYSLLKVAPQIDKIIDHFTYDTLKDYWDKERRWVDEAYQTIPFPFEEIITQPFSIHAHWTLDQLEGYLNSWSSVQHYIKANRTNPVDTLIDKVRPLWPDSLGIEMPLAMRMGLIRK